MRLRINAGTIFFLLIAVISFCPSPASAQSSPTVQNVTVTPAVLAADFSITVSYDPVLERWVFTNKVTKETLLLDKSGIAYYRFLLYTVNQKPIFLNGTVIFPEELLYGFYGTFFVPVAQKEKYDSWFAARKAQAEKTSQTLQSDQTSQTNQTTQNQQTVPSQQPQTSQTDQQQELDQFYAFAKTKMVGYRPIAFIVIDAGHGGKDGGASKNGIAEKDLNLKIAKALRIKLAAQFPGMKVLMTRESDVYVPLEDRVAFANKMNTDTVTGLFISVHANSNPYSAKKKGFEVYFLDYDVADEKIKDLVKYENKEVENSSIGFIINRLLNEELIFESQKLAGYIYDFYKTVKPPIDPSFIKGAPFYVLAYANMPSILLETGYVSNADDAKNLLSEKYLDILTIAVSNGVRQFITEYDKTQGFKRK